MFNRATRGLKTFCVSCNATSFQQGPDDIFIATIPAMAPDSKVRKRQNCEGKTDAVDESNTDHSFKIGRFRINLGHLPELLLFFALAGAVAYIGMCSYDMSRQMAVITGLGVAVQLQRLVNWIRDWVAYKT